MTKSTCKPVEVLSYLNVFFLSQKLYCSVVFRKVSYFQLMFVLLQKSLMKVKSQFNENCCVLALAICLVENTWWIIKVSNSHWWNKKTPLTPLTSSHLHVPQFMERILLWNHNFTFSLLQLFVPGVLKMYAVAG